VVAYKVTVVEELIARAFVNVSMIGLANIILDEKVMPELLQRHATPQNLADALVAIVGDTAQRRRQCEAFVRLDTIMEVAGRAPSQRAAAVVVALARH
jgi:lipid-A-disaccharide synthase